MVAVVAAAVVVAAVAVIRGWTRGDDRPTSTDVAATDRSTRTSATPASEPPRPSPSLPVPTAARPAQIVIIGDDTAVAIGPLVQAAVDATELAETRLDAVTGSGLVQASAIDWPSRVRATIDASADASVVTTAATLPPTGVSAAPPTTPGTAMTTGTGDPVSVVVIALGSGDGQSFDTPATATVGSDAWRAAYGARVMELLDAATARGALVVWVGVPNTASPQLADALAVQNSVVRSVVRDLDDVFFVDAWAKFTGIDGSYATTAFDPRDGETKVVRDQADGFELNAEGRQILAAYTVAGIRQALTALGAEFD